MLIAMLRAARLLAGAAAAALAVVVIGSTAFGLGRGNMLRRPGLALAAIVFALTQLCVLTSQAAFARTILVLKSQPGDFVGDGKRLQKLTPANGTFTGWRGTFVNENNGAGIRPEVWVICAGPTPPAP